jgi:peroxiredoxin
MYAINKLIIIFGTFFTVTHLSAQKDSTLLLEKLYSNWKIVDSNNNILSFKEWFPKVNSQTHILADHPNNTVLKSSKDTPIKQLILLEEDLQEKRVAYNKTQLGNATFNVNGVMPNFSFKDLDGTIYNETNLKGKILVVYVGCFINCTDGLWELAEGDRLYRDYKDSGVVFCAINFGGKAQLLNKISFRNHIKIPLAQADKTTKENFEKFGNIPMRLVIDQEGQLRHKTHGFSYSTNGSPSLYSLALIEVLTQLLK